MCKFGSIKCNIKVYNGKMESLQNLRTNIFNWPCINFNINSITYPRMNNYSWRNLHTNTNIFICILSPKPDLFSLESAEFDNSFTKWKNIKPVSECDQCKIVKLRCLKTSSKLTSSNCRRSAKEVENRSRRIQKTRSMSQSIKTKFIPISC